MKLINYKNKDISLDIKFDEEKGMVWMSQEEIAKLYSKSRQRITNIIREMQHENDEFVRICSENEQIQIAGKTNKTTLYNLDIIREIGYKINPSLTNEFCDWCLEQAKEINNTNLLSDTNIVRFSGSGVELDVQFVPSEATILLSKEQLIKLFDTTRQNIEYHIDQIYSSNELSKGATCKEILQVQIEGGREVNRFNNLYNLDMVISLGYRINTKRGIEFRMWATKVLNEYLRKGYVINEKRTLVTNENYINLIHQVNNIDVRLAKIEKEREISMPSYRIFYEDKEYDAKSFIVEILNSANNEIIIIDPYCDYQTLSIISNIKKKVSLTLITSNQKNVSEKEINDYLRQHKNVSIYKDARYHDRFIIIDNTLYYEIGSSINYIGRKLSTFRVVPYKEVIDLLKSRIKEIKCSATNI